MANTPLSGGSSGGPAGTILVADDSVTMQRVVQMTFAAEDFSVTTVSSAAEAIARAKEMKPDVVLADLSMVGKNGYDICAALKADEQLAQVPVLLLHGSAAPYDEGRAKEVKADGELKKPFDTQALIDKVKKLTAGRTARKAVRPPMGPIESLAPPIESEDVVIDTGALAAKAPAKPAAPPARSAPPPTPTSTPVAKVPPSAPAKPTPKPTPTPSASPAFKPPAAKPAAPSLWEVTPPAPGSQAKPLEITIEAEPPPEKPEPLPSFDEIQPSTPIRPDSTMMGIGGPDLPPPPAGMPLPPLAVPATAAPPRAAAPQPPAPAAGQAAAESIDPAAYEAIAKLSREIIEKVVWEVVPDLAEKIIREELDRLVEKRR